MNQETIMKRRMYTAIAVSAVLLILTMLFIGLYVDERRKTQAAYRVQYMESMQLACDEMHIYIEKGKDFATHYNMILADLGTARSMYFLLANSSTEHRNAVNELFYCFVKYPQQMTEHLAETAAAIEDITANLDSGYDALRTIIDAVDKKGA